MTTKATLYLDEKMYKTVKLRALETNQSVSALMNEALQALLAEDQSDIASIRERQKSKETPLTYETALKELQRDGVI